MNRLCVLLALAAFTSAASAVNVYKWVDADGGIHYGDSPPAEVSAELIDQRALPYVHSTATPPPAPAARRHSGRRGQARAVRRRDGQSQRCANYRRHIRQIEQRMRHGYAEPAGNRWRESKRKWAQRLYRECYF